MNRQQQIEQIRKNLLNIQKGLRDVQTRIKTEGITQNGKVLLPPTIPPAMPQTPQLPTLNSDWRQLYLNTLNKYQSYNPATTREKYRTQLGIPAMETAQTGLTKQVSEVENLLNNLEADINSRASSVGGVWTEAQRRRRLAAESNPLTKRLSDLYR